LAAKPLHAMQKISHYHYQINLISVCVLDYVMKIIVNPLNQLWINL